MPKRILYLGLDPSHYPGDAEIVHCPIIQILPRPLSDPALFQALQNFEHYSHVIVTSKSTVAILSDYLHQLGINVEAWQKKITLAVGKVTAKHLQEHGIPPFRVAQEETAEGIIHELQHIPLRGAHVFWPHSAQARTVIPEFLRAKNIQHTTCNLYDSKTKVPQLLPRLDTFDEIIFTSPSTVDAFLTIFKAFPSHLTLTAIGPITTHYLANVKNVQNSF